MTPTPDAPARKLLWVSPKVHEHVSSMQKILKARLGYRVGQSETVKRGMEALQREIDGSKPYSGAPTSTVRSNWSSDEPVG